MKKLMPIALLFSTQFFMLQAGSQAIAGDYSLVENATPGAMVTTSFGHYSGGTGITPFYGYYTVEIPTMNSNNVIVGRVDKANSTFPMIVNAGEAAKWTAGTLETLGVVACKDADQNGIADNFSCGSRALSINDAGMIGGASHDWYAGSDTYFEKAYRFLGGASFYGAFFSYSSQAQVQDINEGGEYTGTGITNGGGWPFDGLAHGTISPNKTVGTTYQSSQAHALNKFNMATGSVAFNAENRYEYSPSTPQYGQVYRYSDKINFGGFLPGGTFSVGYDVNDNGVVVGLASDQLGRDRAFLWNSKYIEGETHYLSIDKYDNFTDLTNELEAFLQDLGTLKTGDLGDSMARSVNNHDQVVGWSETDTSGIHAFLYENGIMQDLNTLVPNLNGWTLVDAYKITEKGHILVRGTRGSENTYMIVSPSVDKAILDIQTWSDIDPYAFLGGVPQISSVGPKTLEKALSADFYVCNTDCNQYPSIQGIAYATIQSAIDASITGQTVMVLPGIYNENIVINKDITVESWKGPGTTIIDASTIARVSAVQMADGVIDGFTITGGTGFYAPWADLMMGGGISIFATYNAYPAITVKNNVITGNSACTVNDDPCVGQGGGIYGERSNGSVFENNIISNNSIDATQAGLAGSGIYLRSFYNTSIKNTLMSNNQGAPGIETYRVGDLTIDSTVFTQMSSIPLRLGAYTARTTVSNSIFAGNEAASIIYGIVVNYSSDTQFKMYNSTVAHNGKSIYTNAITLAGGSIENSILWDNSKATPMLYYPFNGFQVNDGVQISNSIVEFGYTPASSTNVIDADPLFVNASAGDYRVAATSPAVDGGDDLTAVGIVTDITGTARPLDGNANGVAEFDMGAFEQ